MESIPDKDEVGSSNLPEPTTPKSPLNSEEIGTNADSSAAPTPEQNEAKRYLTNAGSSVAIGVVARRRGGRVGHGPVERQCAHCGKTFYIAFKRIKRGRGRFCSRECDGQSKLGKPTPGFTTPDSTRAERIRANGRVNMRLKRGWFVKPCRCQKCGRWARLDSHHPDYQKPDEVVWLCRSCHMLAHQDPSSIAGLETMDTSVRQAPPDITNLPIYVPAPPIAPRIGRGKAGAG